MPNQLDKDWTQDYGGHFPGSQRYTLSTIPEWHPNQGVQYEKSALPEKRAWVYDAVDPWASVQEDFLRFD